jgi:hypothetical protein
MKIFKKAVAGTAALGLAFVLAFGTSLTARSQVIDPPSDNHRKSCLFRSGCYYELDKFCLGSKCK